MGRRRAARSRCYAHVDPSSPIEVDLGTVVSATGPTYTAPSITTTTANAMEVATYVAHAPTPTGTTWTPPAGTSQRVNLNNGTTRSGTGVDRLVTAAGSTGTLAATASEAQDYALVHVLALRPVP